MAFLARSRGLECTSVTPAAQHLAPVRPSVDSRSCHSQSPVFLSASASSSSSFFPVLIPTLGDVQTVEKWQVACLHQEVVFLPPKHWGATAGVSTGGRSSVAQILSLKFWCRIQISAVLLCVIFLSLPRIPHPRLLISEGKNKMDTSR